MYKRQAITILLPCVPIAPEPVPPGDKLLSIPIYARIADRSIGWIVAMGDPVMLLYWEDVYKRQWVYNASRKTKTSDGR